MNALEEIGVCCPYCGETITLLVDLTSGEQSYTEDCEVCCQPIRAEVSINEDQHAMLTVHRENE